MNSGLFTADRPAVPLLAPTRIHAYRNDGRIYPLSEAADFIYAAGFDGADLSFDALCPWDRHDGREGVLFAFGRRASAHGLTVPLCHLSFYMPDPSDQTAMARFADDIQDDMRTCTRLPIRQAVLHPIVRHASATTYERWMDENLTFLTPLCEQAERLSIRLCIENMVGVPFRTHPGEIVFGTHASHIRCLADRLNTGICWDTGHAHMTGRCQSEEIACLGDRLSVLHLHDNNGLCDAHLIPGDGTVDFADVACGLRKNGFAARPDSLCELEIKTSHLPADPAARHRYVARAVAFARTWLRTL